MGKKWRLKITKTWNVGIFKEQEPFGILLGAKLSNLIFTLSGRRLRTSYDHIATYADPFLFQNDGKLYLFAEVQPIGKPGHINCWQYNQDAHWQDIGQVLKENCHHSYPFIFRDIDGKLYMIPESAQTKEISIWEFCNFPVGLKKVKTILEGVFYDSNIIFHNGIYYLFTTTNKGDLLIFFADKLLSDSWMPHLSNPITNNMQYSRNGGGVIMYGGKLLRIAQNCANNYGGGIIILEVLKLCKNSYEESVIIDDYHPQKNYIWQRRGRHHLSLCNFNGNTFVAMDGLADNLIVNNFINGIYKFLKK